MVCNHIWKGSTFSEQMQKLGFKTEQKKIKSTWVTDRTATGLDLPKKDKFIQQLKEIGNESICRAWLG
jgi:hypothetical protein